MATYTRIDRTVTEEEIQFSLKTSDFAEWKCDTCEYRCIGLRKMGEHVTQEHGEGLATEVEQVN